MYQNLAPHPLSLALTAENAVTWREIFAFDEKR